MRAALHPDQLELVRLCRELAAGLVVADDATVKTLPFLENRLHPLLDLGDVIGRERALDVEVVVEAVGDRRTDAELGVREEILHRLRHDVSRGMADDRPALFGVGGDRLDDVAVLGVVGEVLDRARRRHSVLDTDRDRPLDPGDAEGLPRGGPGGNDGG